jgi:hypothetical protein
VSLRWFVEGKWLSSFTFLTWHGFCFFGSDGPDQELPQMTAAEDSRAKLITVFLPVVVVLLGCGVRLLLRETLAEALGFLAAWTVLSVPLAVLVGHCALSED